MDDLKKSSEDPAACMATLPPVEVLLERAARRAVQHDAFVARAHEWATARAVDAGTARAGDAGCVVVVLPRDAEAIVALGVPCDDCLELVHVEGEGGHRVRFGARSGQHWAALISAHCGRSGL